MASGVIVNLCFGICHGGGDKHFGGNREDACPGLTRLDLIHIVFGTKHFHVDGFLLFREERLGGNARRIEQDILLTIVLYVKVYGIVLAILVGLLHVCGDHHSLVGDILHYRAILDPETMLLDGEVLDPCVIVNHIRFLAGVGFDFIEVERAWVGLALDNVEHLVNWHFLKLQCESMLLVRLEYELVAVVLVAQWHVITVEQSVDVVERVTHHDVFEYVHKWLSVVLHLEVKHGAVVQLVNLHQSSGKRAL